MFLFRIFREQANIGNLVAVAVLCYRPTIDRPAIVELGIGFHGRLTCGRRQDGTLAHLGSVTTAFVIAALIAYIARIRAAHEKTRCGAIGGG